MVRQNPPLCTAELTLTDGHARCELPDGHVGPHRASGAPQCSIPNHSVEWQAESPMRLIVLTTPVGCAA